MKNSNPEHEAAERDRDPSPAPEDAEEGKRTGVEQAKENEERELPG